MFVIILIYILLLVSFYGCDGKAIVFTQTKADANAFISTDRLNCAIEVMHGDISQH